MRRRNALITALLALALAGAALTACGGSDKPGYCSDVDNFKTAVSDLGNIDVSNGGVGAIKSAVQKVETTGTAVVNSAKSEFPSQTTTLKSSLASLQATLSQVSSPETAKAALKQLPAQVALVASSAKGIADAVSSNCS
jgi:hypothetical protein